LNTKSRKSDIHQDIRDRRPVYFMSDDESIGRKDVLPIITVPRLFKNTNKKRIVIRIRRIVMLLKVGYR